MPSLPKMLALLRARKASRATFAQRLERTVSRVEELREAERLRRLELLDYIEALVYHARETAEHQPLRERVNAALRHDEDRLEVEMVRQTLADVHREEGRREATLAAHKRMLLDLLPLRFGPVPAEMEQTIQANQDTEQLAEWLRRVITAADLDSIGIVRPR